MKRVIVFIFILISFRLSAQKGETVLGQFVSPSGDSLPYQLHFSSAIDTTKKYPLIIWLHGKGERGVDNEKQIHWIKNWLFDSLELSNYKSFVLSPQCSKTEVWSNYDKTAEAIKYDTITPEIQKTLINLIDEVVVNYPIDSNRIYMMGISMGGFGVFDLITRYPDRFAAAIPVCGGADPNKTESLLKTPIWAFHGEVDEIVDKRHTLVPMEKIKDEQHLLTIYKGTNHNAWIKAFKEKDLLRWMFQQKN